MGKSSGQTAFLATAILLTFVSSQKLCAAVSQNDSVVYSKVLGSPLRILAATSDSQGNTYLAGSTGAGLATTASAVQPAFANGLCLGLGPFSPSFPCTDAFVMKLDTQGNVIYATYLGGGGQDAATAIAVDASGAIYVAGNTAPPVSGPPFPVTPGAAFPSISGGSGFVTKISADGARLIYSTILPGAPVVSMALDSTGNAYVVANVFGPFPFPLPPGGYQSVPKSNSQVPFVAKLDTTGSSLIYATYLSGSGTDSAAAIAVNASGNVFVAGSAQSRDFPTTSGVRQPQFSGPPAPGASNGFIAQLDPSGAKLVYSTYLGGTGGRDAVSGLGLDQHGNAYVIGPTNSPDFPTTPGAFWRTGLQAPWRAAEDTSGFVAALNPAATSLVYSSYFPGVSALSVDPAGVAYVTGSANAGFPVTQGAAQGCFSGTTDLFAAALDSQGAVSAATYLGGAGEDDPSAISFAGSGIVLAGATSSYDFPRVPFVRRTFGFGQPFVSKLQISEPSKAAGACTSLVIQNAANYYEGPLAPGELISIYGPGIGPAQAVGEEVDSSGNIARALAGVHVLFNGVAAPLLYVQDKQINAIVPFELSQTDTTTVEVRYQGQVVKSGNWEVDPAFPGVFQPILYVGAPAGDPPPPAAPGSIISIFGTGLGQTNPPGITGTNAANPLGHPLLPVKVLLNGVEGEVLYAGDAPTLPRGMFQLNVRIPKNIPPQTPVTCTVPLTIEAGGIPFGQPAQVCVQTSF